MTSLSRRLQRLEATTARLDPSERGREFEEFSRTAQEYIRVAREYLGGPPDREMTISCRNESEVTPVINQMVAYRIRPSPLPPKDFRCRTCASDSGERFRAAPQLEVIDSKIERPSIELGSQVRNAQ